MNDSPSPLPQNGATAKKAAFAAAVVIWIAGVFGAYYAVPKPAPATLGQANDVWGLMHSG